MSRFKDIQKGKKARKTHEFPAPIDAENPEKRDYVDFVVLSGDEEAEAHAAARKYALAKGSANPQQGDVHYDLGLMVHTLVRACVDSDVPGSSAFYFSLEEDATATPPGAFDRMAELVLRRLDRERIAYLHQLQQVWQEHCSPWGKGDTEETILRKLDELEASVDPARPFEIFRLATLGSCFLTLVKQRAALLRGKLLPGGTSGAATTESTSETTAALTTTEGGS